MKIAIPARDGQVDGHFGHCEAFAILTLDEKKKIVDEELLTPPPGCGCKSNVISVLADKGVSLFIAGNIGQGAVNKIEAAGISVLRGVDGAIHDVVRRWAEGSLQTNNDICTAHHDHEGCGSH